MKKILVVVDMQNDFLTGTLANDSAVAIIPNIKREIESGIYDRIIFTRDTHDTNYLNTQEGKKLPVTHCIWNTWGWQVCDELDMPNSAIVSYIDKGTFGYNGWSKFFDDARSNDIFDEGVEFTFTGTCTDICVVSNALAAKAAFSEAQVRCLADCCAPLFGSKTKQDAAFEVMTSCQIDVIREDEVCSK